MAAIKNMRHTASSSIETKHSHAPFGQDKPSKKKKSSQLFLLRLAHSNGYVALPILAITISTYMTIGSYQFYGNYIAFIFFSTLFLYPLHRLIGLRLTIPVAYSQAQKSVSKKPNIARASVIIGFLGTLFYAFHLSVEVISFLMPLSLVAITYSLPLIPTPNGWKRLRDIPGLKIYAISIVVTLTTSSIPLLIHKFDPRDILLLGIQRFLFILAITIPFDVRDVRIDQKWALRTIPIILGSKKALLLSKILLIITPAITFYQFFTTDVLHLGVCFAIVLSHIWAIYIIEKFEKYNAPLFNAYLLEGIMVFQFAVITIAQVLVSF